MVWIYIIIAGLFYIGWPFGLKFAQKGEHQFKGLLLAVVSMGLSSWLLFLAERDISIGTVYAIWTRIGAAGTFLIGIWFFDDAISLGRYLGVILIITGVVTQNLHINIMAITIVPQLFKCFCKMIDPIFLSIAISARVPLKPSGNNIRSNPFVP